MTEKVDVQAVIKAELKVMRMKLSGQLDAAVQRLHRPRVGGRTPVLSQARRPSPWQLRKAVGCCWPVTRRSDHERTVVLVGGHRKDGSCI